MAIIVVAVMLLGVGGAQDIVMPAEEEVDQELIAAKQGEKGMRRHAIRKVLFLMNIKERELAIAAATGDAQLHLKHAIAYRRYVKEIDLTGCPEDFVKAFRAFAAEVNRFDEKALKKVPDFPEPDLEKILPAIYRVLQEYCIEPTKMRREMNVMLSDIFRDESGLTDLKMLERLSLIRAELASGKRPLPEELTDEQLDMQW